MERLSSLKFTLVSLGIMMAWLGLGLVLCQLPSQVPFFQAMDQTLLLHWLAGPAWSDPLAPAWFIGMCLAVGLMLLNLAACTFTRLLPRLKSGSRLKGWLLTLVHLVMLLVLLGHAAEMGLGFKREGLRLLPGQRIDLPEAGVALRLETVEFPGDKSLLNAPYRQARWLMTTRSFDRQASQARLHLDGPGVQGLPGVLRILEPLVLDGLRVTLTDFFREGEGAEARVGIVLTVGHNPLAPLFFAAYGLWALLYAGLAFTTWRVPNGGAPAAGA